MRRLHMTGRDGQYAPDGDYLLEVEFADGSRERVARICETDSTTAGMIAAWIEFASRMQVVFHEPTP